MAFFFPHSSYANTTVEGRERVNHPTAGPPIPSAKLRWIIRSLIDDIDDILETVASFPNLRMYGASLLIVYEGDRTAFLSGWNKMLEEDRQREELSQRQENSPDNDDDSEDEVDEAQRAKLYSIRLIDFAHSFWTEDEFTEQDPGLLLGLRNASNTLRTVLTTQKKDNV